MPERSSVPSATKQAVLLEAGYMCANPRCRMCLALDLHHIVQVSESGTNAPSNLLCICPNCHALHHRGVIPRSALRVWKGAIVALGVSSRANIDQLLQLHRMAKDLAFRNATFTPDALLLVAPLISAGFVAPGGGMISSRESYFRLELTEKGRLLVEAWLAGSEEQWEKALLPARVDA